MGYKSVICKEALIGIFLQISSSDIGIGLIVLKPSGKIIPFIVGDCTISATEPDFTAIKMFYKEQDNTSHTYRCRKHKMGQIRFE